MQITTFSLLINMISSLSYYYIINSLFTGTMLVCRRFLPCAQTNSVIHQRLLPANHQTGTQRNYSLPRIFSRKRKKNTKEKQVVKKYAIERGTDTSSYWKIFTDRLRVEYNPKTDFMLNPVGACPTPTELNKKFSGVPSFLDIVDKCPKRVQPFLYLSRFDKPAGSLMLFYPAAWSICFAAGAGSVFSLSTLAVLAKFGAGSFLIRGACCTINDFWEVNIEKRIIKKRLVPIGIGALFRNKLSYKDASRWSIVQLTGGLLLLLTTNIPTVVLAASGMLFTASYPLFKKMFPEPQLYLPSSVSSLENTTDTAQLFLALIRNWGAILGYSAVAGTLGYNTVLMYVVGVSWTMMTDTVYAHALGKKDDIRLGLGPTVVTFSNESHRICLSCLVVMFGVLNVTGILNGMGVMYWGGAGLTCCMLLQGLRAGKSDNLSLRNPQQCWEFYIMSQYLGLFMLVGIMLGLRHNTV